MKILQSGRGDRPWSREFICTGAGHGRDGCGAVLLVEEGDVWVEHHHVHSDYAFTCPECGVATGIDRPPARVIPVPSPKQREIPSFPTDYN